MGKSTVTRPRSVPFSPPQLPREEPAAPRQATGPWRAWIDFWFAATDPVGLHVLRIASGLVFLIWLLPLAGHVEGLFSLDGWFDRLAYKDSSHLAGGPPQPFTWSIVYLCGSNVALLKTVYWSSIAVLGLFTIGVWTRLTAILTWLIVASFTASPALGSDADPLLLILALYLMIGYVLLNVGDRGQSLIARVLGGGNTLLFRFGRGAKDSRAANLAIRLMQVHFAIVMFVSGLHKLQFGDWWAGTALWYPLHPALETTARNIGSPEQVSSSLSFLSLAAYGMLAWQIGFPAFAWRPRCRLILLGGGLVGWLGCALIYRVPVLGPVLFIGCLSYVSAQEWRRLFGLLAAGRMRFADAVR
jgi:hypothetical protein